MSQVGETHNEIMDLIQTYFPPRQDQLVRNSKKCLRVHKWNKWWIFKRKYLCQLLGERMKFKILSKITIVKLISLNHHTWANRNSGWRNQNERLKQKIVSKHLSKKTMCRILTITQTRSFQIARVKLWVESVIYQTLSKMTRLKDHTIHSSIMIQLETLQILIFNPNLF